MNSQQQQHVHPQKDAADTVVYSQLVDDKPKTTPPMVNSANVDMPASAMESQSCAPTYQVMTPSGAAAPTGAAPQNAITVGAWDAGLWDCFDSCMPNCCMSCFCPCVTLAQVAHRVRWMKYSTVLVVFGLLTILSSSTYTTYYRMSYNDEYYTRRGYYIVEYTSYSTVGLVMSAIGSVVSVIEVIMVMSLRASVRKLFHIPGSACGDCCCSFWCMCCVMAQMATHVKSYKPGDCSFAAPEQLAEDQLPGYQS